MRCALFLVVLLCGLFAPCCAGDIEQDLSAWCDTQKSGLVQESCDGAKEMLQALARFENKKDNAFSSRSPEEVRADIARRQQEKRTRDLLTAAAVAGSLLLLVGLGVLTEKLLKKHHVLSRVRLSSKKRHGTHTLDDVFEIEKRG